MPFTGTTFSYTSPTSATGAVAGQVIQSASWDQIHTDIQNAFTSMYTSIEGSTSVINAGVVSLASSAASQTSLTNIITSVQSQFTNINSMRNFIANGGFEVWQRCSGSFTPGTSTFSVAASTLQYTADRWYIQTGANQASTVVSAVGLSNPSNLCCQVQRNSGQTGVGAYVFAYPLDTPDIVRMHGLKVNFSMLAATGTNWSPTSGTFTVTLYLGTGVVGKRNATPYTNETQAFSISTNLAAGSGATTISGTSSAIIPTTTTQAELQIAWTPTGTASTNDYIQFDDVMLETINYTGTWTATAFDRTPFDVELYLCKRHYQKTFGYGTSPAAASGSLAGAIPALQAVVTQQLLGFWILPVIMRTTPTLTTYNPTQSGSNWESFSLGVDNTSVAVITRTSNITSTAIHIFTTTSGGTVASIQYIHAAADAGI